jgi:hypothetical protein
MTQGLGGFGTGSSFGTGGPSLSGGGLTNPNAPGPYGGIIPAILPAGVSADINALYGSLLPAEWQGIGFPYTRMVMHLRQDLVIHKFADRDGAHIEGTGRHPLQFDFTIPFISTLASGATESWKQPLYPTQWRLFIQSAAVGGTGTLNHPELGALTCKVESCVTTWEGTARGGPTVQASFIESDDTATEATTALSQPSPISAAAAACANLDSDLAVTTTASAPTLPVFAASFSDLIGQIEGLGTQFSLLEYSVGGQLNAIIYQCNSLESVLATESNALNWPTVQAAEQAKDACYTLQGNLLTTGKKVSSYTSTKDATLAELATTLHASLYLLMNLNPTLISQQPVPAGSLVRYYAP